MLPIYRNVGLLIGGAHRGVALLRASSYVVVHGGGYLV